MAFTQLLDKALRSEPFQWSEVINYKKYNRVLAPDGTPYVALQSTGPDMPNPAINPLDDTAGEYWGVNTGFGSTMWQCDCVPTAEVPVGTIVTLPVIDGHQVTYAPGAYSLVVCVDGCVLSKDVDYSEATGSSAKTFTFLKRYPAGIRIHCVIHGAPDLPEEAAQQFQVMALMSDGTSIPVNAEMSDGTSVLVVQAQKTYI